MRCVGGGGVGEGGRPIATDQHKKQCKAAGCTKRPYFGVESGAARWCAAHTPKEAWNVESKRCEAAGCTKHPVFGLLGERKRWWCAFHAPNPSCPLGLPKTLSSFSKRRS